MTVEKIFRHPFMRFLVTGGVVATTYFVIFVVAVSLPPIDGRYPLAVCVAAVGAMLVGFPLYRHFVFGPSGDSMRAEFVRFAGVYAWGTLANLAGLPILVEILGVPPIPAQALLVILVPTTSFFLHRGFTFAPPRRH